MDLIPIGRAAQRAGVAASTLRYYDELGLVRPRTRRGSIRMYGEAELRRIAFVRIAQRFDIELSRIADLLDGRGPNWSATLDTQIEELTAKIHDAESARAVLRHARLCPHERPWQDCDYTIRTLDSWLEAEGEMAFPEDPEVTEVADLRESYEHGELHEADVAADPLDQFRQWLHAAIAADIAEPNAMVLATATSDGIPSARTVLLKGMDDRGFGFYTNLESAKAQELAANPVATLVFPWHAMERQVRVSGSISPISRAESEEYFRTRPRESRLGAWASAQSSVVESREVLDRAYAEMDAKWPADADIPLPEFWGGYRLYPTMYEFWQGRVGRLHDRLRYRREGDSESWILERLAP